MQNLMQDLLIPCKILLNLINKVQHGFLYIAGFAAWR